MHKIEINGNFSTLRYFISEDKKALRRKRTLKALLDPILRFQLLLRIFEYLKNKNSVFAWFVLPFFRLQSGSLGFSIPINSFGPGLRILHRGTIIVTPKARIGRNCTLNAMVQVGPGRTGSPVIGDDCFIGPGAVVLGGIVLGDSVKIGANAVVTHSYPEGHVTLVGIPARPIEK